MTTQKINQKTNSSHLPSKQAQSIVIEKVSYPVARLFNIKLYMARIDNIHPLASGNKYYKLKPNLDYARQQGISRLVSFGGAFSNHLHALALYGHQQGFKTVGIIRGESQYANNPTLQDVQQAGMQLEFVNRNEYRKRHDKQYLSQLLVKYPDSLIIPEGGSSPLAVNGCSQLMQELNRVKKCDFITAACGTGATFAGLVCGLDETQQAIGFSALRDNSLEDRIQSFINNETVNNKTSINKNYKIEAADFGGFAKLNSEIIDFVIDWLEKTNILLDPIYTAKMVFQLNKLIEKKVFPENTSICIIHSGGLQGWRGMKSQVIKLGGEKKWAIINSKLNELGMAQ